MVSNKIQIKSDTCLNEYYKNIIIIILKRIQFIYFLI